MYEFGLVAFLGLAVYAVALVADRFVAVVREYLAGVYVLLGLGAAWLANFDLFEAWAVSVRGSWIGITLTGAVIGGLAIAWREVVGFVAGLERKFNDEAETLEKTQGLRRVA